MWPVPIRDDDRAARPRRGNHRREPGPHAAAPDDHVERQGRVRIHRHQAGRVDDERRGSRLRAPRGSGVRSARGRQHAIDVRLARTATPVALPLDGIKASEIQQRIDRAESLAAVGDLDGAIAAWRDVLARVPALTSVHLRAGRALRAQAGPRTRARRLPSTPRARARQRHGARRDRAARQAILN